jgi:type 1 glutamine amidotransferase
MFKRLLLLASLLCTLALFTPRAEAARIVFMIGEDEYHTWETLPELAEKELKPKGHTVTIITADPANKHNFTGLVEALRDADLLFLSVRRRTPLKEQLDAVRAHLQAGKGLVGIRTASHAFALRPKDKLEDPKLANWQEFDPEVLGGHYTNHHGNGPVTTVSQALAVENHPILKGVVVSKLVSKGSLYKVSPLVKEAKPLLIGTIPNQPPEAVAWTHAYGPKQARVFYTSLGHPDDFQNPEFRKLLANGVEWALGK